MLDNNLWATKNECQLSVHSGVTNNPNVLNQEVE